MYTPLSYLTLGAALLLAGCQPSPPAETATQSPTQAPAAAQPAAPKTEAEARALTAAHIQTLPNAALYVADSARVNDNGATWQVLVPRRDWAKRMPNNARFEVDKTTGEVNSGAVK